MPNYCSCDLYIKGGRQVVLDAVRSEENGEVLLFDFNKIVPMPSILNGTISGTSPEDGKIIAGDATHDEIQYYLNMPWVTRVGIYDLRGLQKFLAERSPTAKADWEHCKRAKKQTGHADWYSWCRDNWGTKWNAGSTQITDRKITFETAWAPPTPVILELSKKFPKHTFTLKYYERGMGFQGKYQVKDGIVLVDESNNNYRGNRGG